MVMVRDVLVEFGIYKDHIFQPKQSLLLSLLSYCANSNYAKKKKIC